MSVLHLLFTETAVYMLFCYLKCAVPLLRALPQNHICILLLVCAADADAKNKCSNIHVHVIQQDFQLCPVRLQPVCFQYKDFPSANVSSSVALRGGMCCAASSCRKRLGILPCSTLACPTLLCPALLCPAQLSHARPFPAVPCYALPSYICCIFR